MQVAFGYELKEVLIDAEHTELKQLLTYDWLKNLVIFNPLSLTEDAIATLMKGGQSVSTEIRITLVDDKGNSYAHTMALDLKHSLTLPRTEDIAQSIVDASLGVMIKDMPSIKPSEGFKVEGFMVRSPI